MNTDLIYGIDDRPPLKETLFAAIQHLLAIFVAIITPPLIIAGALKLDLETVSWFPWLCLPPGYPHSFNVVNKDRSGRGCYVSKELASRLSARLSRLAWREGFPLFSAFVSPPLR